MPSFLDAAELAATASFLALVKKLITLAALSFVSTPSFLGDSDGSRFTSGCSFFTTVDAFFSADPELLDFALFGVFFSSFTVVVFLDLGDFFDSTSFLMDLLSLEDFFTGDGL